MSAGKTEAQELSCEQMLKLTARGCQVAQSSAQSLLQAMNTQSDEPLNAVRKYEDELDQLDRQINEGVTALIPEVDSASQGRELLACLKFILELERIGDLLLNVANRLRSASSRLDSVDVQELAKMASIVSGMLEGVAEAFSKRNVARALAVLNADAELDRLRNLMFVRHIDNPEGHPVREGFHVVFMAQSLERAGDHAKNLAEEICHLVTGRSVRHLRREYDKPIELIAMESGKKRRSKTAG